MAPTPLQQRRSHNSLLFQKLLNLREGVSPFTLVLDTLEQSGGSIVKEFARRAKISKTQITFISFATLRKKIPYEINTFISASNKPLATLRNEIVSHLPPPALPTPTAYSSKYLLIIDTLHPLASNPAHSAHLTPFLSSLLTSPSISLLATYHLDIPLPILSHSSLSHQNPYDPPPLTTIIHLATAILTLSSLSHTLAQKAARDKSLIEPVFGLEEQREGILFALQGNGHGKRKNGGEEGVGVVVRMELRRRSGRGVVEDFVLSPPITPTPISATATISNSLSTFILLDEHPLYNSTPEPTTTLTTDPSNTNKPTAGTGEADLQTTFSLSLTAKQRQDRDGVVLPYFDAQKDGGGSGPGEGGRILYEMGEVDREDFDDEEDEI